MPIYDYQCQISECGHICERIMDFDDDYITCPVCQSPARRIISCSKVNCGNDDAPWLRSVCEVVDTDPTKRHCQEFLKNPTRTNYHKWMKGEGIRQLESGEPRKPEAPDMTGVKKQMVERHRKRRRIEVN